MKNAELKIGTKVSYTKTNLVNGKTTSVESVVKGFYNSGSLHYVCLENGDKMFKEALTVVETNKPLTVVEKVLIVQKLLKECNEEAEYKFKVRRTREMYVTSKLYCLTVVGRTHVKLLEDSIEKATTKFWQMGGGQIHHTSQHNLKIWFAN